MGGTSRLKPATSRQVWYGAEYDVNLVPFRQRITQAGLRDDSDGKVLQGIADRVGISRFTLYRFLNGGPISIGTFRRLCRGLDVPFDLAASNPTET